MGKKVVAADIGASGGKMAYGEFDGERLEIREYRDFVNRPVDIGTAFYWDVFSLYHSIIDGMAYFNKIYGEADTIGIDTWGSGYGLLDSRGRLLEPVYHYRDSRTDTTMEDMKKVMSSYELFKLNGSQCNRTYTLPMLYSNVTAKTGVLELAKEMLFLPDLLGYFLSGVKTTEMTIAGTSNLLENQQENWSREIASRFQIPERLYTEIVSPATIKGSLREHVQLHTGMKHTKLVATVEHDSAAAVAAIPDFGQKKLFVSVGTSICMGVESDTCILTEAAFRRGLKNTGGIDKTKIIYRDFSACWHINEFIRSRREKGIVYSHSELVEMAKGVKNAVPWFDVEDIELNNAGEDFCEKMNQYFRRTNQRELDSDAEFIRSIFESIALMTGHFAKAFPEVGLDFEEVDVINGATRNSLLMQLICNITGMEVRAGMPYATLVGSLLTQLYAIGEVSSAAEMRSLSGNIFQMQTYEPEDREYWREALEKYEELIKIKM